MSGALSHSAPDLISVTGIVKSEVNAIPDLFNFLHSGHTCLLIKEIADYAMPLPHIRNNLAMSPNRNCTASSV